MVNFKQSVLFLIFALIITSIACQQLTTVETAKPQNILSTLKSVNFGSISGIALVPTTEKKLVPASNATIKVMNEKGEVISTTKANDRGQFVVSDIPPGTVKVNVSTVQSSVEKQAEVKAGKVTALNQILLENSFGGGGGPVTITGKVIDQAGQPIAEGTITDITGGKTTSTTKTDSEGKFSLIVEQIDKSRTLEIVSGNLITSTTVTAEKTTDLSLTLIANSRTITGTVKDRVNTNLPIKDVIVAVGGSSVSTTTDVNGKFTLRGISLNQLTIEASGMEGYNKGSVVLNSVMAGEQSSDVTIYMVPIGSLRVNIARADSFIIGCFDEDCAPSGNNISPCIQPAETPENNNVFSHSDPLEGTVIIEGTNIKQTFSYPATPIKEIFSLCGAEKQKIGEVKVGNVVKSFEINNIEGGIKRLTVSMTGMEVQKGLEVAIPSRDIVSTELILLYQVQPAIIFGDVAGKITGVDSADLPNVRVNTLAISEPFDMTGLLTRLQYFGATSTFTPSTLETILNKGVTVDSSGNYLLTKVPTGTRILIAGVYDSTAALYDVKYISKAIVLLNVIGGKVNPAPDINIEKHNP